MNQTTSIPAEHKLSVVEKVGFGLGDTASNILYQAWSFFLAKFYTDVFGISAKHAATMFLVTRIWDMINDPVMGMIADRTNTRWGKFRPYLLWMAVPYGVLACAMFVTPGGLEGNQKLFYAYATYILATMAYTAVNIPYSSMMAVMTPNPQERTTLSQYRFFFAFIGALLITTFTLPLAKFFGNNPEHPGFNEDLGYSQALGYQVTMGVFGGIAIILLVITFLTTRERVQSPKTQKTSFGKDLSEVVRNAPWLILFICCIFWVTHNVLRNGAGLYYFDYVYANGNSVMFTWTLGPLVLEFNQTTVFLTVGTFGMMAGVLLSTPIKKRFGKKSLIVFFSIASVILGGVFYALPHDNLSEEKLISDDVQGLQSIYAIDLDGDSDPDLLSASANDNKIAWYKNDGLGQFSSQKVLTTDAEGAQSVYGADLDGDGDLDILSASTNNNTIAWYKNQGSGLYSNALPIGTDINGASYVYAADLDADEDLDVLAASAADNSISWFENNGTGTFSTPKLIAQNVNGASCVYAADLDADDKIDIISASGTDGIIAWHKNDGTGGYVNAKALATHLQDIRWVWATDLDSDGDMDIVSISATGAVTWYENNVNDNTPGEFSESKVIQTAQEDLLSNLKLATLKIDGAGPFCGSDIDSDGDLDVISALASGQIVWYENDGSSNLALLLLFNFLWSIAAGALPVFLFAMFADAADYHEWKFKCRATGLVIAGIMFAIKMGVAAGGVMSLQILDLFGYVANVPQTARSSQGILMLFSMIPAAFMLICSIALFFYPINEKMLATIEQDLEARKKDEE